MSTQTSIQNLFNRTSLNESSTVKVPGKLFITGEYAILFPKQPAIIIAVDQFLTAQVTASDLPEGGVIRTNLSELGPLNYVRQDGNFQVSANTASGWHYCINAIRVTESLLKA